MKKTYLTSCLRKTGIYLSLFAFVPVLGLEAMYDTGIFVLLRTFCCLSAIICYIKKRKFSRLMKFITLFVMWLLAVTTFYHGCNLMLIYQIVVIISTCAFFDYQIDKNQTEFLLKLYRYYCTTIFLNLLSILLVPEGLYLGDISDARCNYLLGNYNLFIVHILPAVCIGYHLMADHRIKKRNYLFLWLTVVVTYSLRQSMTSIIGLLIFGTFLLFFNKKIWKIVFNPIIYVISTIAIIYLLVFAQSENLINFISSITEKNNTFSGRRLIWSRMLALFWGHWMIGYGIQDTSALVKAVNFYHAQHAHNLILQVIWQGGCIGVFLLGIILLIAVYSLLKVSDDKIVRSYGCALFSLFVMSITEFYEYRAIFSMIVIFNGCCVHIRSLRNQTGDTIPGGIL